MTSVPEVSYSSHAAALYGRPHWWLAAMLLALHAGTAWGIEHAWARGFLLAHFGLFLLWQPLWRGERDIGGTHAALVIVAGVGLAATAGWWIIVLWLALMFGLLGGRAIGTADRPVRVVLLFAAAYVLTLLLAWAVPHLFSVWQPEELLVPFIRYGLVLVPLAILCVPVGGGAPRTSVAIDLFYAALLFLAVIVLVLGSFVLRDAVQGRYAYALVQMLLGLAILLGALSFLWNPHAGYGGLQQLLSRYIAGIGLPFERWVACVAGVAETAADPSDFMGQALDAMVHAARIEGVKWQHESAGHTRGATSPHALAYDMRGQAYTLYLRSPATPGVALHLKLLAELLAYFYEAKMREAREREDAYQRAIHETGARVTHDVKNLLQGLRALCAAAEEAGPGDEAELVRMFKRQLPAVAARVTATLDKLQTPGRVVSNTPATDWWSALQQRYAANAVRFSDGAVAPGVTVPGELFDSVAENLVANALRKHDARRIQVEFDGATLAVWDDGASVPAAVANDLFRRRVESASGLGVGLYHCASYAARLGYRLALVSNEPGNVRFALSRT